MADAPCGTGICPGADDDGVAGAGGGGGEPPLPDSGVGVGVTWPMEGPPPPEPVHVLPGVTIIGCAGAPVGRVRVTLDWVVPQVTVKTGLLVRVLLSAEVRVTLWPPIMLNVKEAAPSPMTSSSNVLPLASVY